MEELPFSDHLNERASIFYQSVTSVVGVRRLATLMDLNKCGIVPHNVA